MEFTLDITDPKLVKSWFDANLSDSQLEIQKTINEFSKNEIRPVAERLDKLTPEEVTDPASEWYSLRRKYLELGFDFKSYDTMSKQEACGIQAVTVEELGWGDMGFTIGMMVDLFPKIISHKLGRTDLAEKYADRIGCWIATQPDRGSDVLDFQGEEIVAGGKHNKGNLMTKKVGDKLIINGQSSAWVSLAPVAEVAILMTQCDYGDGIWRDSGAVRGILAVVPLDLPGIKKGKPLDKIGQRTLPQGEIFFDNVELSADHILLTEENYNAACFSMLSEGNTVHAAAATGVARAVFEHALDYVHERRMGGATLIHHQLMRHRIFKMFQTVEACRGISRRAYDWFAHAEEPEIALAIAAKTYCTENAFQIASEGIQMFGGNGLTKEYPLEKLMRDARATMIEDGENNILGLVAANRISRMHQSLN